MTAGKVEDVLLKLSEGLGEVKGGLRSLEAQHDDLREVGRRQAEHSARIHAQLQEKLAALEQRLIPMELKLAEMEKRTEDVRKDRLAVGLAILSTALSIGSAVVVAYVLKVGGLK